MTLARRHLPRDRFAVTLARHVRRARCAVTLVVLFAACAHPAAARQQRPDSAARALPRVHVLATGGTISNTTGARRTGTELVEGLPGLERVAAVTVEQFSNVASSAITLAQWRDLAARVNALFADDADLSGIVVTHGTDTMEETAYFLELTVADCRPVVVTGAMRRDSDIARDGPANLFNAIRVAAAADARRLGAVVLMNDRVFAARDVAKVSTVRIDAFAAPNTGPVGIADSDRLAFHREPVGRRCTRPAFAVPDSLPRVDVIYTYQGADGALIDAAVAAGARGIVMATAGQGAMTAGQSAAVRAALQRGVIVVRSSRTGSGRVPVGNDTQQPAVMGADDLTPQKARILLMLALTRTSEPNEIRRIFREY